MGLSLFNFYNRSNTWYKEFEVVNGQVIETNINYIGFTLKPIFLMCHFKINNNEIFQ